MLLKTQQRNTEQTLERDTRATRARVLIYSTADRYWRCTKKFLWMKMAQNFPFVYFIVQMAVLTEVDRK